MAESILVTGASGFVGRHMCSFLGGGGSAASVTGTDIVGSDAPGCKGFIAADLTVPESAAAAVAQSKPDVVIHLAGIFGGPDPEGVWRNNALATHNLLEAVRRHAPESLVLVTGSAAEYGDLPSGDHPAVETARCAPLTSYGLSKLLSTETALYFFRAHGLRTMVIRPFQLLGTGISERLAPGAFARRLVNAKKSGLKTIQAGNLDSVRDFLDVRDALEAVWKLCKQPAPGEIFNVCSGKPVRMSDLLNEMMRILDYSPSIEINPAILRGRTDVREMYGSSMKLTGRTGWKPRITLQESLNDMLCSVV